MHIIEYTLIYKKYNGFSFNGQSKKLAFNLLPVSPSSFNWILRPCVRPCEPYHFSHGQVKAMTSQPWLECIFLPLLSPNSSCNTITLSSCYRQPLKSRAPLLPLIFIAIIEQSSTRVHLASAVKSTIVIEPTATWKLVEQSSTSTVQFTLRLNGRCWMSASVWPTQFCAYMYIVPT